MSKIIVAMTHERVIGQNNTIPWDYPEDRKHFREKTLDSIIIMGRKTFASLNNKPLDKRHNIVISSTMLSGSWLSGPGYSGDRYDIYRTMQDALNVCQGPIWFIGGAKIYEEAFQYVDEIHITFVPNQIEVSEHTVLFPKIPIEQFRSGPKMYLGKNKNLVTQTLYKR